MTQHRRPSLTRSASLTVAMAKYRGFNHPNNTQRIVAETNAKVAPYEVRKVPDKPGKFAVYLGDVRVSAIDGRGNAIAKAFIIRERNPNADTNT